MLSRIPPRAGLLALALALALLSGGAPAQTAAPTRPTVIALLAAVGDQIDIVRQKEAVGSRLEPFTRQRLPVNGQTLNYAVLRGLDRAIEEAEPQAQRVLLKWSMPPQTQKALEDAPGQQREALVLPSYFYGELRGMGRKLSGIGIYIQPLPNTTINFGENGELTADSGEQDGNNRTIDPNTGATGKSSTYVAPYMYFLRLTLDARTLEVLARQRQFDNVKYADPNATALDVAKQMPLAQLMGKLLETAERSAYQSIRGVQSEVRVTTPVPVAAPAASGPR